MDSIEKSVNTMRKEWLRGFIRSLLDSVFHPRSGIEPDSSFSHATSAIYWRAVAVNKSPNYEPQTQERGLRYTNDGHADFQ